MNRGCPWKWWSDFIRAAYEWPVLKEIDPCFTFYQITCNQTELIIRLDKNTSARHGSHSRSERRIAVGSEEGASLTICLCYRNGDYQLCHMGIAWHGNSSINIWLAISWVFSHLLRVRIDIHRKIGIPIFYFHLLRLYWYSHMKYLYSKGLCHLTEMPDWYLKNILKWLIFTRNNLFALVCIFLATAMFIPCRSLQPAPP
jgi:hypothetical protein